MPTPGKWLKVGGQFLELEAAGQSEAQISAALGVSTRTVQRWRGRTGNARPKAPVRPESDRITARQLLDDGCSINEVCRTVGVDHRTLERWFPGEHGMSFSEGGRIAAAMRELRRHAGLQPLKQVPKGTRP